MGFKIGLNGFRQTHLHKKNNINIKGSSAVDFRVLLAHFFCKIGNQELHQLESAIAKKVALDAWM